MDFSARLSFLSGFMSPDAVPALFSCQRTCHGRLHGTSHISRADSPDAADPLSSFGAEVEISCVQLAAITRRRKGKGDIADEVDGGVRVLPISPVPP